MTNYLHLSKNPMPFGSVVTMKLIFFVTYVILKVPSIQLLTEGRLTQHNEHGIPHSF